MEIKDNVVSYYNGEFAYWRSEADAFKEAIGKTITAIDFDGDSTLTLRFEDGTGVRLFDDGQSCCENRYMTTDYDDLDSYVGAVLLGGTVKDAPAIHAEYDSHEVEFLEIITSRGTFTMANHNEHNGWYGGFDVKASAVSAPYFNY